MNTANIPQASDETPILNFAVAGSDIGKRLDAFLAENIEGWSRSRLQKLIDDGDILVNQTAAKPSYKLRENDDIDADLTEAPAARFEPENILLDIVFEDEYLAVINKPAGLVVHPGAGVSSGTLANAIAYHFGVSGMQPVKTADDIPSSPPFQGGEAAAPADGVADAASAPDREFDPTNTSRVGIVHRLDKQTSGLIVVAKSEKIHEAMSEQFRSREVFKSYLALVHGSPRENTGIIDRPMARDRWHRTKMTVAANGRNALSLWKVRQRFDKFALVEVEIKTGRTHQIRVHLASINHPVVGDETYNEGRDNTVNNIDIKNAIRIMGRFFLHAEKLSFTHPVTNEQLAFVLPLPDELKRFLDIIS
ncbi:MAG: RluA family pseudouridine synthase [Pyrinomonadaceae bacterium]